MVKTKYHRRHRKTRRDLEKCLDVRSQIRYLGDAITADGILCVRPKLEAEEQSPLVHLNAEDDLDRNSH